jgi:hypothetical protein
MWGCKSAWSEAAARDHDFDFAFACRCQSAIWGGVDDLLVEFGADATAHADDHAFAFHCSKAIAKVVENVLSNQCLSLFGADHASSCAHLLLSLSLVVCLRLL